jgi:hypothetical protein
MRLKNLFIPSLCAVAVVSATHASAESVTDPVHSFGLSASHNQYKLDTGDDSDKERLNKGGVFYNWGNKLTGTEGFIYQIGADAQYGERGDSEIKSGRIELDLGARAALSQNNYLDLIVGAGYDWDRYEYDGVRVAGDKVRSKLDSKTPLAKAALGYNYLTPDMTARLELGTRYSIDGRTKVKVGDFSDHVDMKDKFNPYAELTMVWNKGIRNVPVITGLYYEQTRNQLQGGSNTKLKQEEVGLRLGLQI